MERTQTKISTNCTYFFSDFAPPCPLGSWPGNDSPVWGNIPGCMAPVWGDISEKGGNPPGAVDNPPNA